MDVQVTNSYRLKLGNVIGEISKTGNKVDRWTVEVVDDKDNMRGKICSHYGKGFDNSIVRYSIVEEVDVDIDELYEVVKEIRKMAREGYTEDNSKFVEVKYGI